jgi:hypothetical protein
MDFAALFRRAYLTTINNPALWLFGLFLTSGFNAHWFVLFNQLQFAVKNPATLGREVLEHPADATLIIISLLATGAITLVVSNWAKILLFLHAAEILKLKRVMPGWRRASDAVASSVDPASPTIFGLQKKLIHESQRYFWPVVGVSVLTGAMTIAVAIILFFPAGYLLRADQNQGIVLALAMALFTVLLLFISFQNIFATLFIILYQRGIRSALNLALDLIVTKWQHIAVFAVILLVIYGLGVSAAFGIVHLSRGPIAVGFAIASHANMTAAALLFGAEWILVSLLLLVWVALLNVFSNVALLILFNDLVKAKPAEFLAVAELKNPVPLN